MIALATAVLLTSLLGSLHCAGMCGPFVAIAAGSGGRGAHAAYHAGRLATYALLGALAGAAGRVLDLGGTLLGVQRAALGIAGAAMIAFGALSLARSRGARLRWIEPPAAARGAFAALAARLRDVGPRTRAAAIGMGSTLLPCGWLYAFVVAAAGAGSATRGALTMALFWAGTLPVMVTLGAGVQRLAGPLGRRAPALSAVALMLAGTLALAGRLHVRAPRAPDEASPTPTVASVEALGERPPACHDGDGP